MNSLARSAIAVALLCLLSGCVTNYWLTPETASSEQMGASLSDLLSQRGFVRAALPPSTRLAGPEEVRWEKTFHDWLGENGVVIVTQTTDGGHPVVIVGHVGRRPEAEATAKDLLSYLNAAFPSMHVTLRSKTTCCDT